MFNEYTRVFKYIKPHIGVLWLAFFSMLVCSLMGGVSLGMIIPFVDKIISGKQVSFVSNMNLPPFLSGIVNRINSMDSMAVLNYLIITAVILFFIKQVFEYLKAYFMNQLGYRFLKDIRNAIYDKILNLSLDYFYKNPTGKLTSKILYDTAIIKDSMIEGLTDIIYQPIELFVYFCIIIFVKLYFGIPILLVIISLSLTVLIILPVLRIGRHIRKISLMTQAKVADINMTIIEAITGISIVNAFSMQDYELDKMKRQNHQYYKIMMKSVKRMIAISPLLEFIALFCVAIVLWVGGKGVITRNLSAGAFIAFLAALLSLLKPFKRLGRVHTINQQALAAADRVFEILEATPTVKEKQGAIELPEFRDSVRFEGVSFKYNDDQDVLKNLDLEIKRGRIAAFVGPSGVGKTSLVNLLPRFYDPYKGAVKIDGIDIKEVTVKSLREKIGIVTQDTFLFNDTVAANIAYGHEVAKRRGAIIQAAKAANCHNFIMNMPEGYDPIIGERGFRLPGGEKQRLCIARAI
ncbi:MAG: ABC transporter ATP-binding protein, partial [Candidatus Omnitrophica bacterium]|nr:ABC transporter ATP-binding protein [Candidatus Omnitrophota bacterium]